MREVMTKSMARNIFYGGSLFFILVFIGLFAQSLKTPMPVSVKRLEKIWAARPR